MTSVSIIIPCYNAAPFIRETLDSVFQQTERSLEVILVDDASTDDGADIVEREYPTVHLVRGQKRGAAASRNLAMTLASGAFIQFLDADDVLLPEKIERQMAALETSGADIAYGNWQRLVQSDDTYVDGEVISRILLDAEDAECALFSDFWCPPSAYLFRRSIVERVGGWPLHVPLVVDARFMQDCAFHQARFVYCNALMARYRVHTGSLSHSDPAGFDRDCFINASEIEARWRANDGVTAARRAALLRTYLYVARGAYQRDRAMFETAVAALERVQPGYVPDCPRHLALVSRLVGYPRAEMAALWYRRGKSVFRSIARNPSP